MAKILVAEDEPSVSAFVTRALEQSEDCLNLNVWTRGLPLN